MYSIRLYILAATVTAKDTIDRLYTILSKQVDASNSTTAYDIQVSTFKVSREQLSALLMPEELAKLKDTAFQAGYLQRIFGSCMAYCCATKYLMKKKHLLIM